MAKTKEITPQEYIKNKLMLNKQGNAVSIQYLHRLLKEGAELPYVKKVNNYGRFYTLEVDASLI